MPTGALVSVLGDDINQLERFLDVGANDLIQVASTVLPIGGAYFFFAPNVGAIAMLPMPFIVVGAIAFQRQLAPLYASVREAAGMLNGRLADNLGGIVAIESFTTEAYERDRVARESNAYRLSNNRAIALSGAFIPTPRILLFEGFVSALGLGREVLADRLSAGTFSMLVFLTQSLLWPLTRLGNTFDLYQRAMASTTRVLDLLDTPLAIPSGTQRLRDRTGKLSVRGELALEEVRFAYHAGTPVVDDLSLHVAAGQFVGIVGATGSGKSTLVKLLLRLYDVTEGTIRLDGTDIRELNLGDLRAAIGWVSQDVFLFHGTVAENIAYGSFDASGADIEATAKLAEAHDFIRELPQGYDTIVGERG